MSNILNIVRIVAIILAIVAAFVEIPHVMAALVILGIIAGLDVPQDRRVFVLVMALVLTGPASVLANIPAVGGYLADIAGGVGVAITGVALTAITVAIIQRLMGGGAAASNP